jgi:MurNAc alpha-1-phosphate uridylyltransferase
MRAMILAAGRGERMGALTASTPKPLLRLHGETLIGRQLRRLAGAGVRSAIGNLSYRGEQIRAAIGDGTAYGVAVSYSQEPDPPLETAGGIIEELTRLDTDPFLVVNADVVSDFDLSRLAPGATDGTLVLVPNPPHHPGGDYGIDEQDRLTLSGPHYTFSGISLLRPALFAGLGPGRRALSDVLETAIARGRLSGIVHRGVWFDVGTPERLTLAATALGTAG